MRPTLLERIAKEQEGDEFLQKVKGSIIDKRTIEFQLHKDGTIRFNNRLCVPSQSSIKNEILEEAHHTTYTIHPGETKMFKDLKRNFWWKNMRREVASFVEQCLTCQKVKAERRKPAGELQPLPIPQWKWDDITMDFIVGLPRTSEGVDFI